MVILLCCQPCASFFANILCVLGCVFFLLHLSACCWHVKTHSICLFTWLRHAADSWWAGTKTSAGCRAKPKKLVSLPLVRYPSHSPLRRLKHTPQTSPVNFIVPRWGWRRSRQLRVDRRICIHKSLGGLSLLDIAVLNLYTLVCNLAQSS